jgi:hypothetical protein
MHSGWNEVQLRTCLLILTLSDKFLAGYSELFRGGRPAFLGSQNTVRDRWVICGTASLIRTCRSRCDNCEQRRDCEKTAHDATPSLVWKRGIQCTAPHDAN